MNAYATHRLLHAATCNRNHISGIWIIIHRLHCHGRPRGKSCCQRIGSYPKPAVRLRLSTGSGSVLGRPGWCGRPLHCPPGQRGITTGDAFAAPGVTRETSPLVPTAQVLQVGNLPGILDRVVQSFCAGFIPAVLYCRAIWRKRRSTSVAPNRKSSKRFREVIVSSEGHPLRISDFFSLSSNRKMRGNACRFYRILLRMYSTHSHPEVQASR